MILFDVCSTKIMPLKKSLTVVNDEEDHNAQNGINGNSYWEFSIIVKL